ncbi:MAG: hypothetical protein KAH01_01975 [Caldisericia bacterium]|nr:hypothetical protein [Caldisericia bacterium]
MKNKNIIYFNLPAYGHIYPTLDKVKSIVDSGNTVYYFSTISFKPIIELTGAVFIDLADYWEPQMNPEFKNSEQVMYKASKYYLQTIGYSMELSYFLLSIFKNKKYIWNPDVIMHDNCCLWGKLIAKYWQVKAICTFSTMVIPLSYVKKIPFLWLLSELKGLPGLFRYFRYKMKLNKAFPKLTLSVKDMTINKEKENIVFLSKSFQPKNDIIDKTFNFQKRTFSSRSKTNFNFPSEPFIYISLGTIHSKKNNLLRKIVLGVLQTEFCAVVSTGESKNVISNPEPKKVFFYSSVPQIEVLKKCSFFIHHGGMNSTIEAISSNVPMLIIPQTLEQLLVGYRVKELNKGLLIPTKNPNQCYLNKTILRLLKI